MTALPPLAPGRGIPSWCTAHPETLAAILSAYRDDADPILIEATCNQVNQDGGYTGLTPAAFRALVEGIARAEGVDPARLILGGDHLGPNPWRHLRAAEAMKKARAMVAAYVGAGFAKIHLDASMACAGDGILDEGAMADRAADLCAAAEAAGTAPHYVIGTEVPVPGGETAGHGAPSVTRPEAAARTHALHREAFARRGLGDAFGHVVAMVVQPGVDFSNDAVHAYDPDAARALIDARPSGLTWEAHSTDYQSEDALAALVRDGFGILKVGPELTFAFRQAALALERLERATDPARPSGLEAALRAAMEARPADWRAHVAPGPRERAMMIHGLSDRVRYHWPDPGVRAAWERLRANLAAARPEPGLVAQATGGLVGPVPDDLPGAVVRSMVGAVVAKYRRAAGRV